MYAILDLQKTHSFPPTSTSLSSSCCWCHPWGWSDWYWAMSSSATSFEDFFCCCFFHLACSKRFSRTSHVLLLLLAFCRYFLAGRRAAVSEESKRGCYDVLRLENARSFIFPVAQVHSSLLSVVLQYTRTRKKCGMDVEKRKVFSFSGIVVAFSATL